MSATATEKKPTLSRFAELALALEKHKEKRQLLETQLTDLATQHQAALNEELAKEPGTNPYRIDTEPYKLREKLRKIEGQLETLGPVIETLTAQLNREGALKTVAEVRAGVERMQELHEAAEADLTETGDLIGEAVLSIWNRYAENREERIALRREIEAVLPSVRMLDAEVAARWDALEDPEGPQAPKDVGKFVELLVECIFDPYNQGYRGGTSTGIDAFGRSYPVESGDKRFGRRLPNLLPDLRGQDARVSGPGVESFAGAPEIGADFSVR